MIDIPSINKNLDSLEQLDKYQGKSLTLNDSLMLSTIQDSLIKDCFIFGIHSIKQRNSAPINAFLNYYEKVDSGQIINGQCSLIEEQHKLYNIIHSSDLVDAEKLFLEFSVGLSRFVLAVQIISKFVDYLSSNELIEDNETFINDTVLYSNSLIVQSSFFERVSAISMLAADLINIIAVRYVSNPGAYWSEVDNFFKGFKSFDDIAKTLVSIQYIPNNMRFLSVMQTMHWRGFGGSGEIFVEHPELKNLVVHAFSHHADYKITQSFNKRLVVFKMPLDAMLNGTQHVIVDFLNKQFPLGELDAYDFCSGPCFIAVKGVFEKMLDRKFNLTVSDVDGRSLGALIKEREENTTSAHITITDVCYEDLMMPIQLNEESVEKYHLVSVNLGLHQLSLEKIYAALRHFAMITKVGGLISNLDASEKRYGQLMVIPGNLVDREGHVPYVENMDLTQLVVSNQYDGHIKFAYPMVNLTNKVINSIGEDIGVGPYMVSFYTPVKIKLSDFNRLNELWNLKNYHDCDQIIDEYFPNVKALQSVLI